MHMISRLHAYVIAPMDRAETAVLGYGYLRTLLEQLSFEWTGESQSHKILTLLSRSLEVTYVCKASMHKFLLFLKSRNWPLGRWTREGMHMSLVHTQLDVL